MRDELAENLLAKVMAWSDEEKARLEDVIRRLKGAHINQALVAITIADATIIRIRDHFRRRDCGHHAYSSGGTTSDMIAPLH